jgi:hypothetical protein
MYMQLRRNSYQILVTAVCLLTCIFALAISANSNISTTHSDLDSVVIQSGGFPSKKRHVSLMANDYPNLFIRPVAGTGATGNGDSGDGNSATTVALSCQMIWVDSVGNVYIADGDYYRIRKVNASTGIIVNFGGTGTQSNSGGSGIFSSMSFFYPYSIVGDTVGNSLYMSDQRRIWQYSFATDIISVIAGTNSNGFSGDDGPASLAQLSITQGLWLTTSGVLYLADKGNNRIRMISSGIISPVAGSSGASFSGDNAPATAAYLSAPYSVYVNSIGKIFIADYGNNRIRVIDTNNIITTFAGNGQTASASENIPAVSAELNGPVDVKGDRLGNIFVALYGHVRIRIIDNSGIISTLIGNGNSGFTSGLNSASSSAIHGPQSIWVDSQSNIYISDINTVYRTVNLSPTSQPTGQPSGRPSSQPAVGPSGQPTSLPSEKPSVQPSTLPSKQPVSVPTCLPTGLPTARPSVQPSVQPSSVPSKQPVQTPTCFPSGLPSSLPTLQPSVQPSSIPSNQPVQTPTCLPSGLPSSLPSVQPSDQPSSVPSNQPVQTPTCFPSGLPSSLPTLQPSVQPSSVPSNQPVQNPTCLPSGLPSSLPSVQPSVQPSSVPSNQPVHPPTCFPTGLPSSLPSVQPSVQPSSLPSKQPVQAPTCLPTGLPTALPSVQPSSVPSNQPVQAPTCLPTGLPSSLPSVQPSVQPSSVPSNQPVQNPTCLPTGLPSSLPSVQPSVQPSSLPSKQPISAPTCRPTGQPSSRPSAQPSRRPSTQPTNRPTGQPSGIPTGQPTARPSLTVFSPNLFIEHLCGTETAGYSGDNSPAVSAQVRAYNSWMDTKGDIYIPDDTFYHVRKINPTGIISTFGGTGTQSTAGNSGPIESTNFYAPFSIVGDVERTVLYINDQRYIWRYTFSNNIVSVYAHSRSMGPGFSGDGSAPDAAQLNSPYGMWLTTSGALYVADFGNHRIRKIISNIITTVAGSGPTGGSGSFSGDNGPATSARLNNPQGVFMDSVGKLFIVDRVNSRIRLVDTNNIITTFAGSGVATPFNGENIPRLTANLNDPRDIKGDRYGNLYLSDYGNCVVRVISINGTISTLFGTPGSCGFSAGVSSRSSSISHPVGIWMDSQSRVYFSDVNSIHRGVVVSSPTSQPSEKPSVQPSAQPSKQPVSAPTGLPTGQPSSQPSKQPVSTPTCHPTSQPISRPSMQPSVQPTTQPSRQPSTQPTNCPSSQPSCHPSYHSLISPLIFMQLVAGTSSAGYTGDDGPATSAQIRPTHYSLGRFEWKSLHSCG